MYIVFLFCTVHLCHYASIYFFEFPSLTGKDTDTHPMDKIYPLSVSDEPILETRLWVYSTPSVSEQLIDTLHMVPIFGRHGQGHRCVWTVVPPTTPTSTLRVPSNTIL